MRTSGPFNELVKKGKGKKMAELLEEKAEGSWPSASHPKRLYNCSMSLGAKKKRLSRPCFQQGSFEEGRRVEGKRRGCGFCQLSVRAHQICKHGGKMEG